MHQNKSSIEQDLRFVAYHEAGHAVLRYKSGRDVTEIEIKSSNQGRIAFKGTTYACNFDSQKAEIPLWYCALGGYAATYILMNEGELSGFKDKNDLLYNCSDDLEDDLQRYFLDRKGKYYKINKKSSKEIQILLDKFECAAIEYAAPVLQGQWNEVARVAKAVFDFVLQRSDENPEIELSDDFTIKVPSNVIQLHRP